MNYIIKNIYFLLFLLTLSCSKEPKLINQGYIVDGKYYNPFINWSMPVDSNWRVSNLFDQDPNNTFYISEKHFVNALYFEKDEFNFFKSQIDNSETVSSEKEYLHALSMTANFMRASIQKYSSARVKVEHKESQIKISNHKFKVSEIKIYKNKDLASHMSFWVTKINSSYLTITIAANSPSDYQYMVNLLKKSCFGSQCNFPCQDKENQPIDVKTLKFKTEADKILGYTQSKQYEKLYEHLPPLYSLDRGRYERLPKDAFIKISENIFELPDSFNIKDLSITSLPVNTTKYLEYGGAIVQLCPYEVTLNIRDTIIRSQESLIGIYIRSNDKYYFIENTSLGINSLAPFIPRHLLRKVVGSIKELK